MKRNYKFYHDPGHAWLRVPKSHIPKDIQAKITGFSYQSFSGKSVYLEEDCDVETYQRYLCDS